jgi:hypothetical protein
MERKEYGKDEDRIDGNTDKKDCQRKRKESTSRTHRSIREKEYREEDIDTESDDRSEGYLIDGMECPVEVHDQSS